MLYLGITTPAGGIYVTASDLTTDVTTATLLGTFEADDHNNPAIVLRAGKEPLVFYARHNIDSVVRWRKGTQAIGAGFALGSESTKTFVGTTTYAVAHDLGGDSIDVWCRDGSTRWSLMRSTNWGATFGTPIRVFLGDSQCYMASRKVGNVLRCALQLHPNTSAFDPTIGYCEINLTTGSITESDGTVLGNLDGTNLPLNISALEQVATPGVGKRGWLFDVGAEAEPEIIWASFDVTDVAGTGMYHSTARSGLSWATTDIVATGAAWSHGDNDYPGSAHLAADGTLYLSRESSGTWYIERRDGATTVLATSTPAVGALFVRPFPIVGGTEYECAYMAMTRYTTFNSFFGRILLA